MIEPGALIDGRYLVRQRMGAGAFGEAVLVEDSRLGGLRVLKLAHTAAALEVDRLAQEHAVLSKVEDPAFARVFGVGRLEDGRAYLVQEWVEGEKLADVLRRAGRVSLDDALALGQTLARGLGRLHDAGFVHRDIKPTNVMIPPGPAFGLAKLLDFGVVGELLQSGGDRLTRTGLVVGTPRYMAPEQLQGLPQSTATDVYGLALVLYEMLYGRIPFDQDAQTVQALMIRLMQTDPEIPPDPAVPERLRGLLGRCLSRDPTMRPPDGRALLEELAAIASAPAAGAAGPRHPGAVLPVPRSTMAPRRRTRPSGRVAPLAAPRAPRRWIMLLLAGTIVAAGVAAVLVTTRGPDLGPSPPSGPRPVWWILSGVVLAAGGLLVAGGVRRLARSRLHVVEMDVEHLLLGVRGRRALTETLQLEVEQILVRCRNMDERILGVTVVRMIGEYDAATASDDRQAALMNIATLMDKLRTRLSPWYARFEKQLALASTTVGVLSGLLSIATGILKLARGQP